MRDVQATVLGVVERVIAEGRERGVQVAAYLHGELVVDAWAGVADAATGQPVDGETVFPVFSCSKGVAATVLHLLAERGQIDYDMPVAAAWPEFAAAGKAGITVRHVLSHTAGLALIPPGYSCTDLQDWSTVCAAIAGWPPATVPGTVTEYHALTYGWLVGEIARRVDGRPFKQILEEEIVAPLGLADSLYMGIPDSAEPRVAVLDALFATELPPDDTPQSVPNSLQPLHVMMNRADARRVCQPASNGIMNARALARHYAALLPGGVDGVALLPPSRVRTATQSQRPPHDPNAETTAHFGLGYAINGTEFGHGGYGGATGFADPATGLTVGLTKNLFSTNGAEGEILQALREGLGLADGAPSMHG
jgi:CubicO group peptidase (beta-lactamase class C family)